jgi:C4-dicarboxylate transporter DctM subunit
MMTTGILVILCLLLLLLSGLPVAFSLASMALGMFYLKGIQLDALPHAMYSALDSFTLSAMPLFILMAMILNRGNVGEVLFGGINKFVRHIPGGLAVGTLVCCGIMAAIAGTSTAVAITIGIVAIPAMLQRGYSRKFAVGLMAAGGTLGILIPPSVPMIIYATVTGDSIGDLFMAGVVPGILLTLMFCVYVIVTSRGKKIFMAEEKASWEERWKGLKEALMAIFLVPLIIGGIYTGIFTPTEAAGVGVVYSLIICLFYYKTIKAKDIYPVLMEGMIVSSMLLMIVAAALAFSHAVTFWQIPQALANAVVAAGWGKWTFVIFLNLLFLLLGCFLETIGMILITIPIFLPIIKALNIDSIWLCVILVINMELAMITPPVGLNLFVLKGIVKDTSFSEIFTGSLPFCILMVVMMILVMLYPPLATWLPSVMIR